MTTPYFTQNYCIFRTDKENCDQLTNFTAEITKELHYHDGPKVNTYLEITGHMPPVEGNDEPIQLPTITIPASDFAGLGWVAEKWGMRPIIFPVAGGERALRTAIQLASKPEKRHIYTHSGWTTINGWRAYLSTTGAINANGLDPNVLVELPHELRRFALPAPTASQEAFHASLALKDVAPPHIAWPLLLAAYRAAYGPVDFALHLAGRTGTFKSELTSLVQSHFGQELDARHLPGTWSSTVNALEHLAYRAKDAIFTVDDYVPLGTAYQVRTLASAADRLFRAQGNQGGRSRLTETSAMQTTYYPRGLILSTGEDIPEGHSMRGRMFILELRPGDVSPQKLSDAQARRPHYSQAMADWIAWLAREQDTQLPIIAKQTRDSNLDIGHPRTPAMLGDLYATAVLLFLYAAERGWLSTQDAQDHTDLAFMALYEAAENQTEHLQQTDPVVAFVDTVRNLLTSLLAHCKTRQGGIPSDAERWGWTKEETPGEMPRFRSNGPIIGWLDHEAGELLIDPGTITLIKRHSGGKLAITPQTLMKRIKEANLLARTDDTRQRNTVRVTIEGHPRQLMAFRIADINADD